MNLLADFSSPAQNENVIDLGFLKCRDTAYEYELIRGDDILHTLKLYKQEEHELIDTVENVIQAVVTYDGTPNAALYYIVGAFDDKKKLTTKLF